MTRTAATHRGVNSETVTFQPAAALAKDTSVRKNNATTNYGVAVTGSIADAGSTTDAGHILIAWDLSTIPAGTTCRQALMHMFNSGTTTLSRNYTVYEMIDNLDWTEGTANGTINASGADWNTKNGVDAWAGGQTGGGTLGTEINPVPVGSFAYIALGGTGEAANTEHIFALRPSVVSDHFGGTLNLLIKRNVASGTSTSTGPSLHMSDSSTAAYRPKLTITYTTYPITSGDEQTFEPTEIPLVLQTADATSIVANPMSGPYRWSEEELLDMAAATMPGPYDEYERTTWVNLETSLGVYDWSIFDDIVTAAAAASPVRKPWFRMQPIKADDDDEQCLPSFMRNSTYAYQNGAGAWIPDFTLEATMARAELLIAAAGTQFDGVVRAWDIGMLGDYGEWTDIAGQTALSLTQYQRIIDATVTYFPLTYARGGLLAHCVDQEALDYILDTYPLIGVRGDSFGHEAWGSQMYERHARTPTFDTRMATAWRTRLVTGENWNQKLSDQDIADRGFDYALTYLNSATQTSQSPAMQHHVHAMSNGNINNGSWPGSFTTQHQKNAYDQYKLMGYRIFCSRIVMPDSIVRGIGFNVTTDWHNFKGISYRPGTSCLEPFVAKLWLYQTGTTTQVEGSDIELSINLQTLYATYNSPTTVTDATNYSTSIPAGTYDLRLLVEDSTGFRPDPLNLAQTGRESDGSYQIAEVTLI